MSSSSNYFGKIKKLKMDFLEIETHKHMIRNIECLELDMDH